jgi:spermidine synthase
MVIELLGTRMIAPFYGASIYVWTSLISVTMIALSLGYFIGGRWADSSKNIGLSLIISLAGLLTLLIPWATRPVLLATDQLGLRAGAFTSALLLFSPSLLFLGMVSPFAIKLATKGMERIATSSGSIYAVSTLGSVIGTLLLGFFLFPAYGSREILIGVAFTLMLLAMGVAYFEKKYLNLKKTLLPIFLLLIISLIITPQIVDAGRGNIDTNQFKVKSEKESLYGWVRVIDQPKRDLRFLTSDASMIGAASLSTDKTLLAYQEIVNLIPALSSSMKHGLIIGLGAGHMAKMLHNNYGLTTDTLEIDPAVAEAAVKFFDYQATGKAIVGDARYEIRHLKGNYDLIIHDCFTGGSEPAHLLTVETLQQLQKLMTDDGILAINFVSFLQNGQNKALASVAQTVSQVFPHYSVFISEPGEDFNDFIFLASKNPINLNSEVLSSKQRQWLNSRLISIDASQGVVLSDNLNPLEHLQTRKAEHYRQVLLDWFGTNLLIR